MVRIMKLSVLALFFCLFGGLIAKANTQTAASCNTSDVQAAINSAAEGDTVIIPPGTCTWTSGVSISGKGIIVRGAGSGRIIAYSSTALTLGTGTKTLSITSTAVNPSYAITPTVGQTLRLSETGHRQNYMTGTVTSFSSGTLVMNITATGGSCGGDSTSNCARWLISTTPSTLINNASASPIFSVTEASAFHTNLSGFKIAYQNGASSSAISVGYASGGVPVLIHDCWIEAGSGDDGIFFNSSRGVVWNCSFDSTPYSMAQLAIHSKDSNNILQSWAQPDYTGTLDTNGNKNLYIENSDFHAFLNAADNDDNGRMVWRYNLLNNAGFGSHGFDTSSIGQRYFEYYNNIGVFNGYNDGTTFNMNWWFYVRGGTYIIHDNTLPALQSGDYGTKADINMTEQSLQRSTGNYAGCWGQGTSAGALYHAPRQVGYGHLIGTGKDGKGNSVDGTSGIYVGDSDPAYIWANSRQPLGDVIVTDWGNGVAGASCALVSPGKGTPETVKNYIVENRDYFNGSTPKPGYTPYAYPHPLTQGSGGSTGLPPSPTGLVAVVQ